MKVIVLLVSAVMLGLSLTGCKALARLLDGSGTVYVVEVETNEPNRAEIIDQIIRITQHRMDVVGIDGEVTRPSDADNQIEVKIYGSQDPEFLRRFLFTTYRLELKKVVSPPSPAPAQMYPTKEKAEAIVTTGQQALPYKEQYMGSDTDPSRFVIVEKEPIITGEHIRDAQAISYTGSDLDYQISFDLKSDGAAKLGDWTGRNIKNYMAVVLDDKIQSVAYIKSQIFDRGEISGRFTKAEAEEIAMSLKSGYMPATLRVVEQRSFK
jgi:preprotein translocase subunit SecD